ncbi:DUF262 domain-containing protein [Frankia sp. CNm7]|uniref:DUF262 domain-containing protein n=1 Tax=Frankia nepalensis TaxID=1836974 RepID=A0A937URD0_9ACTN|nr:DUF262 domain-containing protein [Frankia nepalensis]MBL7496319.1 DUF262 domain-containing protein [Frankia nepalensis]MBL7508484.1 DUF262 domain-containing protein [Frankia nepalensis]MBL7518895.1 DUF262 domain-containing protein [Frankia nepalensis]MBL7627616.1 DUF262 domain-containing protein [Frankia nepalensis]
MALDNIGLEKLLRQVAAGQVQLPEFQRAWKWDDDRIRSLLATVTLDYPLGVVMTLETGGETRFRARALHGVPPGPAAAEPEQLLLDGQQRLTSLYQALLADRPVDTEDSRHKAIQRWYYVEIDKAIDLSTDREEAIVSVPPERVIREDFGRRVRTDLSTTQGECAAGLFPLNIVFDNDRVVAWQRVFVRARADDTNWDRWSAFEKYALHKITRYQVPMIKLPKETDKVAVCAVFEKVNTGGVVLNVFELLTAMYAGDSGYFREAGADFHLAQDWEARKAVLVEAHEALAELQNIDFLQAVALVVTYQRRRAWLASGPAGTAPAGTAPAIGCKRRDLLDLPLADYRRWADQVADAFAWTGAFLREQCVFQSNFLPYRTQLIPLAAIRVILGDEADKPEVRERLARWYWCGVLGELYSGTFESRFSKDVEQVVAWVAGGPEPDTIVEATFHEQRLATLTTRNSAAYKGVYALLVKQGAYDWHFTEAPIDGDTAVGRDVDIRMIFPKSWFQRTARRDARMNSVVNKTVLSYQASQRMTARAPAAYLDVLARESGVPADWLDDRVATHLIEPALLRAADFDAFYADRTARLLDLVDDAMGKRAVRAAGAGAAGPADA